jgi:hypothetical protein
VAIRQPVVRVRYELQEVGRPDLADALAGFLERRKGTFPHAAAEFSG